MTEVEATRSYTAFISYSHNDSKHAKWIHESLENYEIDANLVGQQTKTGVVPSNLRPVFKDREDFHAGTDLESQTCEALDNSNSLIIICSPNSANSDYVNEEVRYFRYNHPDRPVIPIITAGEPNHAEQECFPASLKFSLLGDGAVGDIPSDILAADIRESGDGKALTLSKVVARMTGLPTDEVHRREERRRTVRNRYWFSGLSAVIIMLAGLAFWAELNRREATHNFQLAMQGADALVIDIAQGLRDVPGMQVRTVETILGRAEEVMNGLIDQSGNNQELKRSQIRMYNEFVDTYINVGDTSSAIQKAEQSYEIARKLSDKARSDADAYRATGRSIFKLGDTHIEVGNFEEARTEYENSLDWRRKGTELFPKNLQLQRDVSISLMRLGELEEILGQFDSSKEHFADALEIRRELVKQNSDWKRDLVVGNIKLGDIYQVLQQTDEAGEYFARALEIAEELRNDSGNTKYERDLAIVFQRIGNLEIDKKNGVEAEDAFNKSLKVFKKLSAQDPGQIHWKRDIAISYLKLGHASKIKGNPQEAHRRYLTCLTEIRVLLAISPNTSQLRIDESESLMHLAQVSVGKKQREYAAEANDLLKNLKNDNVFGEEQQGWLNTIRKLMKNPQNG